MRVAVLVDPGSRSYDVQATLEVFEDRQRLGLPATEALLAADSAVVDLGRVLVRADTTLADLATRTDPDGRAVDLVVVPGRQQPLATPPAGVVDAIRAAHADGVRIAALCTGAFALGAAGLLDGIEATTHWRWCDPLARAYPRARVRPNVLYVADGPVMTSAGVSAGTDLLLEVLRRRHGAATAAEVARSMVTPAHRPGGQAQFVPPARTARPGDLECLQTAVLADLTRDWTLAAMADAAHLTQRTLGRRFSSDVGESPTSWLIGVRLAAAQEVLETTDLGVKAIAHATGFGSADLLRKHFRRRYGVSPTAHRAAMQAGTTRNPASGDGPEAGAGPGRGQRPGRSWPYRAT